MDVENFVDQVTDAQNRAGEGASVYVQRADGAPESVQSVEIDDDGDIIIHID